MSGIRILSVGQCGYDGARIGREIGRRLGAEVVAVDTHDEARSELEGGGFDLVLVNRVGDLDGAPGLGLIAALKADRATSGVPVMLVSNYAEAQAEAVRAGALPGFGKSELGSERVATLIEQALAASRAR